MTKMLVINVTKLVITIKISLCNDDIYVTIKDINIPRRTNSY